MPWFPSCNFISISHKKYKKIFDKNFKIQQHIENALKNGFFLFMLKIKIILLLVYWKDFLIYNSENYEFIDTTRDANNNNVIGVIE